MRSIASSAMGSFRFLMISALRAHLFDSFLGAGAAVDTMDSENARRMGPTQGSRRARIVEAINYSRAARLRQHWQLWCGPCGRLQVSATILPLPKIQKAKMVRRLRNFGAACLATESSLFTAHAQAERVEDDVDLSKEVCLFLFAL